MLMPLVSAGLTVSDFDTLVNQHNGVAAGVSALIHASTQTRIHSYTHPLIHASTPGECGGGHSGTGHRRSCHERERWHC
jgi:hypothetical protein